MEVNYGFVDVNNALIGTSVCIEGDIETIERVKQEYSATAYYPVGEVSVVVDSSIWTGEYFTPGSPYPSWTWDSGLMLWQPPVAYPEISTESTDIYDWDEEAGNWVLVYIE
jgi:hypothetical protein